MTPCKFIFKYQVIKKINGKRLPERVEEFEVDAIEGATFTLPPSEGKIVIEKNQFGNYFFRAPNEKYDVKPGWREEKFDFCFESGQDYLELYGSVLLRLSPEEAIYINDGSVSLREKWHNIPKLIIPDGVSRIDSFFGDTTIEEIVLPESVTELGSYAFGNCRALEKINLPRGIKAIGNGAFSASALKEIALPSLIERIESSTFENTLLEYVIIPEHVNFIGKRSFAKCKQLKGVFIPASVQTIENDAFATCPELTIYCEGTVGADWRNGDGTVEVAEDIVTPEDDAFNFHRSAGGFTSHTVYHSQNAWLSWNPDNRPVKENTGLEKFIEIMKK